MANVLDFDDEEPLTRAVFAVRVAADHQVVGIFVADDLEQLADIVDEAIDPATVEYLRLGSGGAFVAGFTEAQWPPRDLLADDGEVVDILLEDAEPLNGASLSEAWSDSIDRGDWLPLLGYQDLPKRPPERRRARSRR